MYKEVLRFKYKTTNVLEYSTNCFSIHSYLPPPDSRICHRESDSHWSSSCHLQNSPIRKEVIKQEIVSCMSWLALLLLNEVLSQFGFFTLTHYEYPSSLLYQCRQQQMSLQFWWRLPMRHLAASFHLLWLYSRVGWFVQWGILLWYHCPSPHCLLGQNHLVSNLTCSLRLAALCWGERWLKAESCWSRT